MSFLLLGISLRPNSSNKEKTSLCKMPNWDSWMWWNQDPR